MNFYNDRHKPYCQIYTFNLGVPSMRTIKILLTLIGLFLTVGVRAAPGVGDKTPSKWVNSISMSFCDVRTSCQKCSETVFLKFERLEKEVFISGKGIDGTPVREPLSNCSFSSSSDWLCESGRYRIAYSSGKISVGLLREISVSGVKQEVCIGQ